MTHRQGVRQTGSQTAFRDGLKCYDLTSVNEITEKLQTGPLTTGEG